MKRHWVGGGMGRRGFTLIELLVVIVILFILIGSLLVTFGTIFRSQGLRQAAIQMQTGLAKCRTQASKMRRVHFLKLFNRPSDKQASMQIYVDADEDKNLLSPPDQKVGEEIELASGVTFGKNDGDLPGTYYPDWIAVYPTGYLLYKPPYVGYQQGPFEAAILAGNPVGDVVIKEMNRDMRVYSDLDQITGKVRKNHFWGAP